MRVKRFVVASALLMGFNLAAAVNVTTQVGLLNAFNGADKEITITGSFKTTQNITIPEGFTVTVADGQTLTLGTYKYGFLNLQTGYYTLSGSGTLVYGGKKITATATRTLSALGGTNNRFAGMTYEVTSVVEAGGKVSMSKDSQLACPCSTAYSVDDGKTWIPVSSMPAAVVCSVSSGLNGGRVLISAHASFEEAYNAAKFTSSYKKPTNGKVVVLLSDGAFSISEKLSYVGVVVDCAGNKGEISRSGWLSKTGEFADQSCITYLNASAATVPSIVSASYSFINCASASIDGEVNDNQSTFTTQMHVYDGGSTLSIGSTYPDAGGAFIYSGGPYSTSFGSNWKVFGGTFSKDPTSYLGSSDLEAVQGSDGYWTVQEKAPVVNVAAIGSAEYETLQAAVDAAASGAKVTLLSDITLTTPVTVAAGKNLTVELAGMDIAADAGVLVNNGSLKLEDSSNFNEPSTLSTASGNLIVNNGTLEITYGTYAGTVLLNAGMLTVHHAVFDGSLKAGVADPTSVANLRGGQYKTSVAAFLKDGYLETLYSGYYWVGQFPFAQMPETSLAQGEDMGWKVKGLSDADRALFANTSELRADYTDDEWYRRAELKSMVTPYGNYRIDCVVTFNRSVAAETACMYPQTSLVTKEDLDRDLAANESYRVLSTTLTEMGSSQVGYSAFLSQDEYKNVGIGIKSLSDENAGTLCTVEFQLCTTPNGVMTKKYVLASVSYQFPWPEDGGIPVLRDDDPPETVASALDGKANASVIANVTDGATCNSYRQWADALVASGAATADGIKASGTAWLSYALNAAELVETPVDGDLAIDSLNPSETTADAFDIGLSVKGVAIGKGNVADGQMKKNLAQVFSVEGATTLSEEAFSAANVDCTYTATSDGKVSVEAKPVQASDAFFIRARLTR